MEEVLNYKIKEFEGIRVIEFIGNLTVNTVKNFQFLIESFVERESIMIDISGVKLITSAGLTSLVDVSVLAKNYNKRVIVIQPDEDLIQMTDTIGVSGHLIFSDSLEEGQTKIKFYI